VGDRRDRDIARIGFHSVTSSPPCRTHPSSDERDEERVIGFLRVDLGHYVRELAARPYVYAGHIVPHDARAKELGTGKSRLEVLESLGLKNLQLAPMRMSGPTNGFSKNDIRIHNPR
jgi:hypothetical protein